MYNWILRRMNDYYLYSRNILFMIWILQCDNQDFFLYFEQIFPISQYMKKTIYLVRHCRALGQEREAELSEIGMEQVPLITNALKNTWIEAIFTSPMKRAIDSIRPLADELKIPVFLEENLSEKILQVPSCDDWMEKVERSFLDHSVVFPWGESAKEAQDRWMEVLNKTLESTYDTICIVTHGAMMTLLLNYFDSKIGFEFYMNLENPDIYKLTIWDSVLLERFLYATSLS